MNLEVWLYLATLATGLCYGLDRIIRLFKLLLPNRLSVYIHYIGSFFLFLLIPLLIRSFLIEPARVPSGSQKPTLLVGDFVLVNKFAYGLHLPIWGTPITTVTPPKRGDIVVFRYPPSPSIYYIKRIIGLPGDHIQYQNKTLYINGKIASQKFLYTAIDEDNHGRQWPVSYLEEDLLGRPHAIYKRDESLFVPLKDFNIMVPQKQYFAMGDNRDNSQDSRHWGFIPEANLAGQVKYVFFSWNRKAAWLKPWDWIRWRRIGLKLDSV
jgi:signal peptidase I